MSINIEKRFKRIIEALNKWYSDLWDMSDDELTQVITGNLGVGASDLTDKQLEEMIREAQQ
jgi:succinate dehydrogenase flavin-adding protein (antitoxin of CptAB toxin-antitoxin module)